MGRRASWGAKLGPSPGCLLFSLMHAVPLGCKQVAWSHWDLCIDTMLCLPCSFINGLKAMKAEVKDARVVFYGAGSSAVGVAQMIATLLQTEGGLSEEEARKVRHRCWTAGECVCPWRTQWRLVG